MSSLVSSTARKKSKPRARKPEHGKISRHYFTAVRALVTPVWTTIVRPMIATALEEAGVPEDEFSRYYQKWSPHFVGQVIACQNGMFECTDVHAPGHRPRVPAATGEEYPMTVPVVFRDGKKMYRIPLKIHRDPSFNAIVRSGGYIYEGAGYAGTPDYDEEDEDEDNFGQGSDDSEDEVEDEGAED